MIVTAGPRGARLWSDDTRWTVAAPGRVPVNPIGAGDALMAGLCAGMASGSSLSDALAEGVAWAAGQGPGLRPRPRAGRGTHAPPRCPGGATNRSPGGVLTGDRTPRVHHRPPWHFAVALGSPRHTRRVLLALVHMAREPGGSLPFGALRSGRTCTPAVNHGCGPAARSEPTRNRDVRRRLRRPVRQWSRVAPAPPA